MIFRRSPSKHLRRAEASRAKPETAFRHYARAARRGSAEGAYQLGRSFLEGRGVPPDRHAASAWLETAAELDHVDAQLALAGLHLQGLGRRTKNSGPVARLFDGRDGAPGSMDAVRWSRRAAQLGSVDAQALLAVLLCQGPEAVRDEAEGAHWAERAAAGNSPVGMACHASLLLRGAPDEQNRHLAACLLESAAERGLPAALVMLGHAHEQGLGRAVDLGEAAQFYRRAAEARLPRGQMLWGRALVEGRGVAADGNAGEMWLRRAAFCDDRDAQALLGELNTGTRGFAVNFTAAALWYRRAAAAGHSGAARALGQLYLDGAGVVADPDEARRLFRQAAADGDPLAQVALGNLALLDGGHSEDRSDVCRSFAREAAEGDPIGAFNYGVCLAEGIGVPRCDSEAIVWFRRASAAVDEAKYWYGRFLLEGRGVAADPVAGEAWIARAAKAGVTAAETTLRNLSAARTRDWSCDRKATIMDAARFGEMMNVTVGDPNGRSSASVPFVWARNPCDDMSGASKDLLEQCPCGSTLPRQICCEAPSAIRSAEAPRGGQKQMRSAFDARRRGGLAEAENSCRSMLTENPQNAEALWLLATVRRDAGDATSAEALLKRTNHIDPNHLETALGLATLLFERSDLAEAEWHARNAVRLAPNEPRSNNILAMVLTEAHKEHAGEYHYRRVLALTGTRDPIVLANLAWNLKGQGKIAEGRALYEESVAVDPGIYQTWLGWAQLEEADNCLDAARSKLDQAEALRSETPELAVARSRLLSRAGRHAEALATLAAPSMASAAEDPNVSIERGRLLDRLGRYDEAFDQFAASKSQVRAATGKTYLASCADDMARRLRMFFKAHRLSIMPPAQTRDDVAQPLFILGFPRSGTTMLEQALSSHNQIAAGDELPFINDMADAAARMLGSPLEYPEALSELWMGDRTTGLSTLRDLYLEKAAARGLVHSSRWFTDKMPLNEMHLGLISMVFPHSPLLHVIRHPMDAVLSAFSHHLTHGYFCAASLESTALHYRLVMELVDHYRAEMRLHYLAVRYEDLVQDLEGQVRRILSFVDVPFDAGCVDFHHNPRRPQTPSYAQVAERINDRSLYRFRNYRRQLEPVRAILQPVIEKLGYPMD